ncbi:MAG TPA: GYF domain-containing protein [Polyangiaceae bacterium]
MSNYRLTNDGQHDTLDSLDSEDETLRAGNHKSSGTHSNEWLVNVADDVVVPMVTTEVVEALRAGRLTNRSLVWRIGMHDWSPLAEVPQLRLAAGPSALPSAASTPGPIVVKKPPKPTAEQRRLNTLPMGFPAVRDPASVAQPAGLSAPPSSALSTPVSTPKASAPKREDSSDALAVYDRPAASLTFSDSVRAEWQGKGRIVDQSAASPAPANANAAVRQLTPVPAVPSRLPVRAVRALPTNTLAPTTAEAENVASTRGVAMWGDRSVVFASELRAVKKTSKRVALWAALGSALVASGFTFWAARAPVASVAQAPASAPAVVAADREPAKANLQPAANAVTPVPSTVTSALPVAGATTTPAVAAKPTPVVTQARAAKRAKPSAPASTDVPAPAPTEFNPYADDDAKASNGKPGDAKPSDAKASDAKPTAPTASQLNAAMATAVQAPSAPAAPAQPAQPATPSTPPASASAPAF